MSDVSTVVDVFHPCECYHGLPEKNVLRLQQLDRGDVTKRDGEGQRLEKS